MSSDRGLVIGHVPDMFRKRIFVITSVILGDYRTIIGQLSDMFRTGDVCFFAATKRHNAGRVDEYTDSAQTIIWRCPHATQ